MSKKEFGWVTITYSAYPSISHSNLKRNQEHGLLFSIKIIYSLGQITLAKSPLWATSIQHQAGYSLFGHFNAFIASTFLLPFEISPPRSSASFAFERGVPPRRRIPFSLFFDSPCHLPPSSLAPRAPSLRHLPWCGMVIVKSCIEIKLSQFSTRRKFCENRKGDRDRSFA